ncbi:hypothetical protein [Novosphingobium sp. HII-3]|uniref:hypothetical protein n=1 Tax=Novosphingobium sp. HII-3 TaxID=2075565 RepID=UPI000CDB0B37|nr:hypothetical protein [Novosphingobium sp. HII-3]
MKKLAFRPFRVANSSWAGLLDRRDNIVWFGRLSFPSDDPAIRIRAARPLEMQMLASDVLRVDGQGLYAILDGINRTMPKASPRTVWRHCFALFNVGSFGVVERLRALLRLAYGLPIPEGEPSFWAKQVLADLSRVTDLDEMTGNVEWVH